MISLIRTVLPAAAVLLCLGCDDLQKISHSRQGAYEASLTAIRDGLAVAWYDDRDGNPEIYFRLLAANGKPASVEHRITNDPEFSYEADIQAIGDDLAVAWYARTTNGELHARLAVWTQTGVSRWTKVLSPAGHNGRNPIVRFTGSEVFTAWIEDLGETADVWGQWWSLQGEPISHPQRLAPASRTTWNLNARIDDEGRVWLVFDANTGTQRSELFLLRITRTETSLVRFTSDDGFASKYPDLALSGNRAAVTWFDERDGNQEVYLFTGPLTDLREGMEHQSRRVTNTPGESMGAYVASGANAFGLAWCDNTPGQHEIYFQSFDYSGTPLQEVQRVTHTPTESLIPSITALHDGFALAWNEYKPKGPGHTRGGRSEIAFSIVR